MTMDSNSNPTIARKSRVLFNDALATTPSAAAAAASPAVVAAQEAIETPRKSNYEMGKAMRELDVTSKVTNSGLGSPDSRLVFVESIPRHKADKKGAAGLFTTNLMTWNVQAQDRAIFSVLAKAYAPESFTAALGQKEKSPTNALMASALHLANTILATNGPSTALWQRFVQGYSFPTVKPAAEWLPLAKSVLKFDISRMYDISRMTLSEVLNTTFVAMDANAGLPWRVSKRECTRQAYEAAVEIWDAIIAGKLPQFMNENPWYFTALLRNKMDRYPIETDSSKAKVRPYYSFSYAATLLFSAVQQKLHEGFKLFTEDPESCYAVGFSWNKGGANKLAKFIDSAKQGMRGAIYGDDGLWVLVDQKGERFVVCPDISQMDARHDARMANFIFSYYKDIAQNRLGTVWLNILQLNCRMDTVTTCVLTSALTAVLYGCNKSGLPGTTDFNTIYSAAMLGWVKRAYAKEKLTGKDAIVDFVRRVAKHVQTVFGLPIKEETLAVHSWDDLIAGIPTTREDTPIADIPCRAFPFTFLGYHIAPIMSNGKTNFVPLKSMEDVVCQLVNPRTMAKAKTMTWRMDRMRSAALCGAWPYEAMMLRLQELYVAHQQMSGSPSGEDDEEADEESSVIEEDFSALGTNFPPALWCLNQYLPANAQRDAPKYSDVPSGKKVSSSKQKIDLGSLYSASSWADAEFTETADPVGKGMNNVKLEKLLDGRKVAATNKPGRRQPLRTAAQKEALRARVRERINLANDAVRTKLTRGERIASYVANLATEHDIGSSSDPDEDDETYANRAGFNRYHTKAEEEGVAEESNQDEDAAFHQYLADMTRQELEDDDPFADDSSP